MAPGDRCAWPRCASGTVVGWLGKPLCERHWEKVCEMTSAGQSGYLKAYETLKVSKRFWAKFPDSSPREGDEYGELPDPDKFDY